MRSELLLDQTPIYSTTDNEKLQLYSAASWCWCTISTVVLWTHLRNSWRVAYIIKP